MNQELPVPTLMACAERLGQTPVHLLKVDERWTLIIDRITKFKERLDRVLNYNAWAAGEVTAEDQDWARRAGFEIDGPPSGEGVCPQRFAEWIVGPFRRSANWTTISSLSRIPSWSAVGWRRKRHIARDEAQAEAARQNLERRTAMGNDGTGYWLEPLPLVICGEGKHRAQMYAQYFPDMLINLRSHGLPAADDLRLRRVLGAPRLLALQHRSYSGDWETALLPFPEMSQPLFAAMGVHAPTGWWIPWPFGRSTRQLLNTLGVHPVSAAVHPDRLRSAVLRYQ
jgi:hypothetical protein